MKQHWTGVLFCLWPFDDLRSNIHSHFSSDFCLQQHLREISGSISAKCLLSASLLRLLLVLDRVVRNALLELMKASKLNQNQ